MKKKSVNKRRWRRAMKRAASKMYEERDNMIAAKRLETEKSWEWMAQSYMSAITVYHPPTTEK